jgi:hypothetical protein
VGRFLESWSATAASIIDSPSHRWCGFCGGAPARVRRPGSGERMGGAAAKAQSTHASGPSNWLTVPACRSPLPRVPITEPPVEWRRPASDRRHVARFGDAGWGWRQVRASVRQRGRYAPGHLGPPAQGTRPETAAVNGRPGSGHPAKGGSTNEWAADAASAFVSCGHALVRAQGGGNGQLQISAPFALGGKQCKLQHRDATGTRRSSCNFDVRVNAGGRRSTLL